MLEKDLTVGFLLDFYGDVLSERKRTVLDYYYNDDLSLAEIAEQKGVSRQSVSDCLNKSRKQLESYEEKLGFARTLQEMQAQIDALTNKD